MPRKYTAQDMREMASVVLNDVKGNDYHGATYEFTSKFDECVIEEMLRQAAEDLEREESREKKYEYALVANGVTYNNHYCDFRSATLNRGFGEKVVRRAIGEWEEVQDAQ